MRLPEIDVTPFAVHALRVLDIRPPLASLAWGAWRLANRLSVRALVGGPLVLVLGLAAAGVQPWIVWFAAIEAVVVLGVWLFGFWFLRRLDRPSLVRTDKSPATTEPAGDHAGITRR